MDQIKNPFAPGAGSRPPELAGREDVVSSAQIALQRILSGKHDKSQILLGLRGTGKTVLLNKIEQLALDYGYITSFIEAPENQKFVDLIYPKIQQALHKLSIYEKSKEQAYRAMRALAAFARAFKISVAGISISVDPEAGIADSGILEYDLSELFIRLGEAAAAAQKGWCLLIDEVQYLSQDELSSLIVAIHRVNQKGLPVIFFGAGLPQVAALSGNAKSYAERLFNYPPIGPLDPSASEYAIKQPVIEAGEKISDEAIKAIINKTKGYPYFLQEWGFHAWNIATGNIITIFDIEAASPLAIKRLDEGFFRVRFERLTPKERKYVLAMAKLGEGPYRSSDVAEVLGEKAQSLGPCRANIVNKGMIYSPSHGDIAFTVPMFEDFLKRNFSLDAKSE